MLKSNSVRLVLAALCGIGFAGAAQANGACTLTAQNVSGTYGFAGEGVATANTPFAPSGAVVQSGTVTHVTTGATAQVISGTWSVILSQLDSSGYKPGVQFGGTFQVSTSTCQGDFYVNQPVQLKAPAFHVVFVGNGDELRTVSLIPNLFIAYPSAKKL